MPNHETEDKLDPKQRALDTLSQYGLGVFPVNPVDIANNMGVRVYADMLDKDLAGAIFKDDGGTPVIVISMRDAPVRQRFTCAHELGHLVKRQAEGKDLDFLDKRDGLASEGTDPEEIWANQFAANLLMPESEVRARVGDSTSMSRLTEHFGVSAIAMAHRLAKLKLLQKVQK